MTRASIHPDLQALSFLLGTWAGSGLGEYPTIDDFAYEETATYSHIGKPFVAYGQKTKREGTGEPLHSETGYFRPAGGSRLELVLAQPSGILELHSGEIHGQSIELTTTTVVTTPTAKEVTTVQRSLSVDGDSMRYRVLMGAVGQPHQLHLTALLSRIA